MGLLIALALAAWFIFGSPAEDVAGWFWKGAPAPWETVDAFYYPDRNDLTSHVERQGLPTLDACREWVSEQASARRDPDLRRGDYECGIGKVDTFAGLNVYRATVK